MRRKLVKRKKRRRKPNIVNRHHVSYDPEIMAYMYQGEHQIITLLERRTKNVSQGFIDCLKLWIEQREGLAVDITSQKEERTIWRFE